VVCQRVVLALPPRLAAGLTFDPPLSAAQHQALASVPTWMAAQGKAFAVYRSPFWRTAGLSGDAASALGPLGEIHDTSVGEGFYALFGFLSGGWPRQQGLEALVVEQLVRLFGPEAAAPLHLVFDWAEETWTCSSACRKERFQGHPHYGMPATLADGLWAGRLLFAGTELAEEHGGFMEGALAAAEHAFEQLRA
jgi:monoamine oxidase